MNQTENYWRRFPHVEALFQEGRLEAFLQHCEHNCAALDAIVQQGDQHDAEKARMAMTAYGHTLQLLDQLASVLAGKEEQHSPR
ncbi:MAG: hypothetical protein MUF01_08140 [Bryobacterales bacterium]|jgi:hypothetical protein|nr:hypothetical protein [Bryobacterales bacterium]